MNFTLFVDLGNLEKISMQWTNRDVISTVQLVNTALWNVIYDASFLNNDDDVGANDEDDESIEKSADEKNEVDTEEDDEDD